MKNEHRKMPGRSAVDCLTRSVLGIKEKRLATSPSALLKRRIKRFEERGFGGEGALFSVYLVTGGRFSRLAV